jgi:DNA polymerase III subunit alpha
VHGEVRIDTRDEEHPRREIIAAEIELLSAVRSQKTAELALRIDADALIASRAEGLRGLLARHTGACAVTVRAVIPTETETTVRLAAKVSPTDEFIEAARRLGFEVELR